MKSKNDLTKRIDIEFSILLPILKCRKVMTKLQYRAFWSDALKILDAFTQRGIVPR